jgi:beta-glucosidase
MSHNSQELGNALADVLFGTYNPAGRLTQTWPVSDSLLPPLLDYNIRNGRTYMYPNSKPLYPFGYGLSYTRFEYSDLKISTTDKQLTISFIVKNTGDMDGDEVPQVYISHLNSAVVRPVKELKGFSRKLIKKGEIVKFEIPVDFKYLQYWDAGLKKYVQEKNALRISIGSSSEDIRLQTDFEIK